VWNNERQEYFQKINAVQPEMESAKYVKADKTMYKVERA
jgi:hypothetical protein